MFGGCLWFGVGVEVAIGLVGLLGLGLRSLLKEFELRGLSATLLVVEASGIWAWSLRIAECTLGLRDWNWNCGIGAIGVWVCGQPKPKPSTPKALKKIPEP